MMLKVSHFYLKSISYLLFTFEGGDAPDLEKILAQYVWCRVNPKPEYPEISNKNNLPIDVETHETDAIRSTENQDECFMSDYQYQKKAR